MGNLCRSVVLVVSSVVVAGGAHAAEAPLLVAVEVAPGVDVAPADVRQAVASELGTLVVGSREPDAAVASGVLVVGLDARELRMSLRAGIAPPVSRTITMPPDRPGRLRSIGWLAGNLVRDQVGPLVATPHAEPASAPRPATEPPALAEPSPTRAGEAEAVVASRARGGDAAHSTWAITAAGGPTVQASITNVDSPAWFGTGMVYHIEASHQATPESFILGVALEAGPDSDQGTPHFLGVAPFIGSGWHGRLWFIEGTLGLGLEALIGRVKTLTASNNSSTGTWTETDVSFKPVPGLYARLQGTGGLRVSRRFDVMAQVGAHLSPSGLFGSYLSSGVGLRLRLP